MPSPSSRTRPDGRTTVTYVDADGRRRQRTLPTRRLAEQFQHTLITDVVPTHAANFATPPSTPARPAHHRSIHPLRQLAQAIADDTRPGLTLTFRAPPGIDAEQDWLGDGPDPAHLRLTFHHGN